MTTGERSTADGGREAAGTASHGLVVAAWLWVGVPLLYGLYELVQKAAQLFTG